MIQNTANWKQIKAWEKLTILYFASNLLQSPISQDLVNIKWSLCLQVDVSDPRFQAMFTSHLFNLDPSHPSFKKTKATQSILEEKHRRRELGLNAQKPATALEAAAEPGSKQEGAKREKDSLTEKKAMDPSLSLLVKSIKSKTEQFQARKKQKVT